MVATISAPLLGNKAINIMQENTVIFRIYIGNQQNFTCYILFVILISYKRTLSNGLF